MNRLMQRDETVDIVGVKMNNLSLFIPVYG